MPLTPLQRMAVNTLRLFRTEHDYVGGGAALNRGWPRLSDDMDIFRDDRNQLPEGVEWELQALRNAGFSVEITANDEWMVEAILRMYGSETKIQWLDDAETCRRFFPAIEDEDLGFRLHQADLAVNKVLCASRRNTAPRDAVDLVSIVRRYSPLGPLIWAATGKVPDLGPPSIIRDIRSIAFGYADEEIRAVRMEDGSTITRVELRGTLDAALDRAYEYCDETAPIEHDGRLFVDVTETPVEADSEAISNGTAKAMPVKDFTAISTMGD